MRNNNDKAIAILAEGKRKFINLKNAILEGVNSGINENFDPEKHLQELKNKINKK